MVDASDSDTLLSLRLLRLRLPPRANAIRPRMKIFAIEIMPVGEQKLDVVSIRWVSECLAMLQSHVCVGIRLVCSGQP
jgi:hypothetical protein